MSGSSESANEKIIKSKKRVQNHGEVFTPKRIVKKMLDLPNIREACQNLTSTFLEPAAGEGAFLVEVLNRKMKMVVKNYGDDLTRYENYSLLALSTLYGVELLEDNAQKCVMNMYQVYYEAYQQQAIEHGAKVKNKVLDSAKLIISNNIAQGNFLTKLSVNGNPIVFSEWQPVNFRKDAMTIKVQRTEYTIEDILDGIEKESGEPSTHSVKIEQLDLFADFKDFSSKNIVECDLTDYAKNDNAKEKLLEVFGDENLKFDVIIGNPPYQEMDGGAQASASPIYQNFVLSAKEINPELVSFIMPTRWYTGGKGLDDFRDEMLNDIHLRELHDWLTPEDIFPNTNIRGGVCYFLWDKNYDNSQNLTRVVTHENNAVIDDVVRPMKIECADIFVRDGKSVPILAKVLADGNTDIMLNFISPLRPFGFRGYFVKDEKFRPTNSGLSDPIICYGKGKAVGYLERNEVTVRPKWIDVWKVFTPRANNIGTELNDDNLNTFVGTPKTICTESYLVIGAELGLDEASCNNLSTYLTTRFVRYLHSLAKGSQDAASRTYRFVPVQDFSNNSDIDWSVSVQEVDNQLHNKYGLSDDEINHIETRIKAM